MNLDEMFGSFNPTATQNIAEIPVLPGKKRKADTSIQSLE